MRNNLCLASKTPQKERIKKDKEKWLNFVPPTLRDLKSKSVTASVEAYGYWVQNIALYNTFTKAIITIAATIPFISLTFMFSQQYIVIKTENRNLGNGKHARPIVLEEYPII